MQMELEQSGCLQWNPSTTDTIGNQHFVPYSEVSTTRPGAFGIYPVGVVLRNQAIEHNVAVFQSFPLLYAGREG